MSILQTKNLSKHFDGVKAVDGLSADWMWNMGKLPNLTEGALFWYYGIKNWAIFNLMIIKSWIKKPKH